MKTIAIYLLFTTLALNAKDLSTYAQELQIRLENKIFPYWFDTAQDTIRGGYLLNDDEIYGRLDPKEKQIVTQSRMIWGFSQASLEGLSDGKRDYLEAATQGYHFLLNHFLDRKNGGFFWNTDLHGTPFNRCKFLYAQSFVIYAFVEYYRASQNREALEQAIRLYETVQLYLHDRKNGGWFEAADENWRLLSSNDSRNQFGRTDCKSANAHLDWMEALCELYDESRDLNIKESLIEALIINQTYFFPENPSDYSGQRKFNWRKVNDPESDLLSYGHNVEFAWLMIRAETVLNREPSWHRFYQLLDHTIEYGYDHELGGVYLWGIRNLPAHETEKTWWVQAEMLIALTYGLEQKRRDLYEIALKKLLDFMDSYATSSKDGIWINSVTIDGKPKNNSKADSWKANYHDVRAFLKFIKTYSTLPLRKSE